MNALDLLPVVVEALDALAEDWDSIDATEGWPLPDEVTAYLDLCAPLVAVLDRIYQATTDEGRRRIDEMIEESLDEAPPYFHGVPPVFLPEVKALTDSALEAVRRSLILDPEVRDALRSVR